MSDPQQLFDLAAELRLLRAVQVAPGLASDLAGRVTAEDFYDKAGRLLWPIFCDVGPRVATAYAETGAFLREIEARGLLDDRRYDGDLAWLKHSTGAPTIKLAWQGVLSRVESLPAGNTHVDEDARRVAELAQLRALRDTCGDIAAEAGSDRDRSDVAGFVADAEDRIQRACQTRGGTVADLDARAPTVASIYDTAAATLVARSEKREGPVPVPWPALEERLGGGLWPGLHVLVGGTGSGKTQLALQLALHAARADRPVLYVGLELGQADLVARLVSLAVEGAPHWSELWHGTAGDPGTADLLTSARDELCALPLRLEIGGPYGWHYTELAARARALVEAYRDHQGPALVVLDYLQVVGSADDREELRMRIQRAAYEGRRVARDLDCAVLLVSSVPRAYYYLLGPHKAKGSGADVPPPGDTGGDPAATFIGLGKEAGEIEFSADTVLAIWRDKDVRLVAAKVRAGETGVVNLHFDGSRFAPGAAPPAASASGPPGPLPPLPPGTY
jgi:replicative DNA helicase